MTIHRISMKDLVDFRPEVLNRFKPETHEQVLNQSIEVRADGTWVINSINNCAFTSVSPSSLDVEITGAPFELSRWLVNGTWDKKIVANGPIIDYLLKYKSNEMFESYVVYLNAIANGVAAALISDSLSREIGHTFAVRNVVKYIRENNKGLLFESPLFVNPVHQSPTDLSICQAWWYVSKQNEHMVIRRPIVRSPELKLISYEDKIKQIYKVKGEKSKHFLDRLNNYLNTKIDI